VADTPTLQQPAPTNEAAPPASAPGPRAHTSPYDAPARAAAATLSGVKGTEDCGSCVNCLDKRKFGGPGLKRKACMSKRAVVATPVSAAGVHSPCGASISTASGAHSVAGPSSLGGWSGISPFMGLDDARIADLMATSPVDRAHAASAFVTTPILAGLGATSPAPSLSGNRLSPAEAAAVAQPRGAGSSSAAGSSSGGAYYGRGYRSIGSMAQGHGGEEAEGRAPLNDLPVNHSMTKSHTPLGGVPSTPMKTPEIQALISAAVGGASPLSDLANILDSAQHLPSSSAPGGAVPEMSPLFQLANLMERTPRLPMPRLSMHSAERPADPDELKHALLNSSLGASPLGSLGGANTPEQLRNDLRAALQQSGFGSFDR